MKQIITLLSVLFVFSTVSLAQDSVAIPAQESHSVGLAEQVRGVDESSNGFIVDVLRWYDANMNYGAVAALMTLESSFVPFPSEVVIPPAVYVASNPESEGGMKVWLVVLMGTLGAMIGAFINYYLARWLGRPIIYKFADSKVGHLCQLSGEKMERAEKYFNDHGNVSTLVGRFIPVIRQLISIPAGLSRMNVGAFAFYTFLGAFAWNCILAALGYMAYQVADLSVIEKYSHLLSIILIALFGLACLFVVVKVVLKKRQNQ